jgi:hypothetical protein
MLSNVVRLPVMWTIAGPTFGSELWLQLLLHRDFFDLIKGLQDHMDTMLQGYLVLCLDHLLRGWRPIFLNFTTRWRNERHGHQIIAAWQAHIETPYPSTVALILMEDKMVVGPQVRRAQTRTRSFKLAVGNFTVANRVLRG